MFKVDIKTYQILKAIYNIGIVSMADDEAVVFIKSMKR